MRQLTALPVALLGTTPDNPVRRHLSGWRKPALAGVFRENCTGGLAALRLVRGHQRGEIQSWPKPVDASRGVFADGGSIPPASTIWWSDKDQERPKSIDKQGSWPFLLSDPIRLNPISYSIYLSIFLSILLLREKDTQILKGRWENGKRTQGKEKSSWVTTATLVMALRRMNYKIRKAYNRRDPYARIQERRAMLQTYADLLNFLKTANKNFK